ncbi:ImmA/IrrE family metallo-endopeptidase [Rhizobium sp. B230/85]|uniref:XRE family transcriptional regulator n=1 Tax=unclassified Rhizobium TaxID=2613769 RepID=UPI001ADC9491|nr:MULTISPECIES: XRE family transcriptional regulator [unclassified Rhizobium]MBO9135521.1 ImmA/IrrE family metallo-endopeptidase [Rhizobium sp. B209b/85]QXZ96317.1 ImmA/IrrE family metallo-endopeptidase [Rhizobium sp. B230/85]
MATTDNILAFPRAAQSEQIGRLLIPERLTEARLAARITQTELAERVGVSRQAVSSYEAGSKNPEPSVMITIASILNQPIIFFTKERRSDFGKHSANFFRKTGADTKRRNQACDVYARWLSSVAHAFNNIANYPSVDIPSFEPRDSAYSEEEIEECAEKVRQHFGLGLGPISNVLRLLESKGVIISRCRMDGETVEAFSFWSGSRPFIFLASTKESAARARFDAAHELAHLCLHRWVGSEEIDDPLRLKEIEREADRFAGAFLLPGKSFPNEVYSARAESFIDLKARWKVSIQAMVYRAKDLGLFDDRQVTNIYKQISFKKWRTTEPLDKGPRAISFEEPLLLKRVTELVLESGRYSIDSFKSDVALSDRDLERLTGYPFVNQHPELDVDYKPTLK